MKVLLIFGFATLAFAEKNDTSLLPTRKHKKRLKNERKSEEKPSNYLSQRSNSKVTNPAQKYLDRTHSCKARQEKGVDKRS